MAIRYRYTVIPANATRRRAKAGGETVNGQHYKGGQWIPVGAEGWRIQQEGVDENRQGHVEYLPGTFQDREAAEKEAKFHNDSEATYAAHAID